MHPGISAGPPAVLTEGSGGAMPDEPADRGRIRGWIHITNRAA